mgnify:CR=1 FL=1
MRFLLAKVLPNPLKLINEGDTLAFSIAAADGDNDAIRYSLVRDAKALGYRLAAYEEIFDPANPTGRQLQEPRREAEQGAHQPESALAPTRPVRRTIK